MRPISNGLNQLAIYACIVFFFFMLAISATGTLYKIITGDGLSWTFSLSRQFLPWFALLSITVAFHSKEHVAMTLVLSRLPARARSVLNVFILSIWATLGVILVIYGGSFAIETTQIVMISDQIQIPQRLVLLCLPVTGAILVVHAICSISWHLGMR